MNSFFKTKAFDGGKTKGSELWISLGELEGEGEGEGGGRGTNERRIDKDIPMISLLHISF